MKRILVTGENSYIGTSFVGFMEDYKDEYVVETISVRGDEWKEKDFSNYDVIYHVAGIAHQKETEKNKQLYYDVNYILTKEVAEKAKEEGIGQFIFLSTISVYGKIIGEINLETSENPVNSYGDSKLMAEYCLKDLESNDFKVTLLRPPMVYGSNCKGNYSKLRSMVIKLKLFPNVNNDRSMIYIENLSLFVKIVVDYQLSGLFLPQNLEYVKTVELIKSIGQLNNVSIHLIPFYYNQNFKLINLVQLKKMLGSLTISRERSFNTLSDDIIKIIESSFIGYESSMISTERVGK